jgi:hypothetical protein
MPSPARRLPITAISPSLTASHALVFAGLRMGTPGLLQRASTMLLWSQEPTKGLRWLSATPRTSARDSSRRRRCREPTPVSSHYAPHPTYKTAGRLTCA